MPADVVRFGDDLELDRGAFELRRSGRPLKLERIPMEILLLMVQRRGQLVAREEIVERIWGKDVFLDTDTSINSAIRKIRQVLNDDPENPAFLQTVTAKGYRFIAAVTEVSAPAEQSRVGNSGIKARAVEPDLVSKALERKQDDRYQPASDISTDLQPPRRDTDSAPVTTNPKAAPATAIRRRWKLIAPTGVTVLALSVGGYFYLHRTPKLTDKDTIVLADFTNTTGDPVFDGTLRQGMAVQLEQSPFLSLISEERIQQTLRMMGQPADARLTPEIAREVCERTTSAAVLDGSIANLGSQYVLGLRARACRTGDILAEEQVQAARKEDVLKALGEVASKFRSRIGESLATVEKYDTPLAEATTPSLDALKAYSMGWKVNSATGSAAAVPFFKQAIEIDPKFAMAYALLGRMYGDIGESVLSAESTTKAYQLRDRASDNEKFFISASYDMQVTGSLEKAQQTCELWMQAYPRAIAPHAFLSGIIYPTFGKFETAAEEATITIRLDPDFPIGYGNLASSYVALGRLDEAETTIQRAFERKLQRPFFPIQLYAIAFLKDDKSGMERVAAQARGKLEWKIRCMPPKALYWHIPVICNKRERCLSVQRIWLGRRIIGKERRFTKQMLLWRKPSSEMRFRHGRELWRLSSLRRAGK